MYSSTTEAIIDMFSGTGELAGNAVIRLQTRLMLQRGLTTINNTKGTLR